MGVNRRDFLKLAGLSAAAGAGFELLRPGQAVAQKYLSSQPDLAKKRWAMVIDMKKFWAKPDRLEAAVHACHQAHNVPHVV
ncbi:MAG: twin-arginine translocation signal domain-containing protein, partial [Proteobacteria bacterium]|nr:twin-arginine translocation signal domain-containing protein [Pseudomonadota bacterium]